MKNNTNTNCCGFSTPNFPVECEPRIELPGTITGITIEHKNDGLTTWFEVVCSYKGYEPKIFKVVSMEELEKKHGITLVIK